MTSKNNIGIDEILTFLEKAKNTLTSCSATYPSRKGVFAYLKNVDNNWTAYFSNDDGESKDLAMALVLFEYLDVTKEILKNNEKMLTWIKTAIIQTKDLLKTEEFSEFVVFHFYIKNHAIEVGKVNDFFILPNEVNGNPFSIYYSIRESFGKLPNENESDFLDFLPSYKPY